MKTKDLRPNAAILIAVEIANAIKKNVPKMKRLLERYQAHQLEEYFVNYTEEDIDFLGYIAGSLQVWGCDNHLTNEILQQYIERALGIIDGFTDVHIRERCKRSLQLLVCLRLAESKNNDAEIRACKVELEAISVDSKICIQCDFCIKCIPGENGGRRTYLCKDLNPNCPQERCDDFSNRLSSREHDE